MGGKRENWGRQEQESATVCGLRVTTPLESPRKETRCRRLRGNHDIDQREYSNPKSAEGTDKKKKQEQEEVLGGLQIEKFLNESAEMNLESNAIRR